MIVIWDVQGVRHEKHETSPVILHIPERVCIK